MVRFEVLDTTRLVEEDTGRSYSLGSGGYLLAYLMLHAPEHVERRKCAKDLYPEEDYEISGNRLRVALTRFKKMVGGALIIGRADLALDISQINVDYVELKKRIQASADLIDPSDELEALTAILPQLGMPLLPDISELWVRHWQEEWRAETKRVLKRLAHLANEAGNWQLISDTYQTALKLELNDVELWKSYLRSLTTIDELDRGIRDFKAASKLEEFNWDSSLVEELKQYIAELKTGQFDVENRWTDSQLIHLGRLLARAIEDTPKDAASFFMTPGATREFARDPSTYVQFLYDLVATDEVMGEIEQDMRLLIIDAEGLRYNWKAVIQQTDNLLAQEMEPPRRARTFFGRSFAFFQGRDFESAVTMIQESAAIYRGLDDYVKTMNCQAVEGSFRWHMGEYEKALAMYAEVRKALLLQDNPLAWANYAINWANTCTVYIILGDWKNALMATNEVFTALGSEPNENMLAMFHTLAGLTYIANEETQKGIDLLVDGLKRSFRRGSSREQQIGLEWAAGALFFRGYIAEANSVLDWVENWRKETQHERSVAENHYADRIKRESGRIKSVKLDPSEDNKRVIGYVINLLRKSESRQVVA